MITSNLVVPRSLVKRYGRPLPSSFENNASHGGNSRAGPDHDERVVGGLRELEGPPANGEGYLLCEVRESCAVRHATTR